MTATDAVVTALETGSAVRVVTRRRVVENSGGTVKEKFPLLFAVVVAAW